MGQRQSEIIKNHMEVYWHDYASASKGVPITEAGLVEKASVIGRTGLMLLECGTGAWRVRSSMNTLSRELGVTTTADIGLLSIEFTCFDGDQCLYPVTLSDKYGREYLPAEPTGAFRQRLRPGRKIYDRRRAAQPPR